MADAADNGDLDEIISFDGEITTYSQSQVSIPLQTYYHNHRNEWDGQEDFPGDTYAERLARKLEKKKIIFFRISPICAEALLDYRRMGGGEGYRPACPPRKKPLDQLEEIPSFWGLVDWPTLSYSEASYSAFSVYRPMTLSTTNIAHAPFANDQGVLILDQSIQEIAIFQFLLEIFQLPELTKWKYFVERGTVPRSRSVNWQNIRIEIKSTPQCKMTHETWNSITGTYPKEPLSLFFTGSILLLNSQMALSTDER